MLEQYQRLFKLYPKPAEKAREAEGLPPMKAASERLAPTVSRLWREPRQTFPSILLAYRLTTYEGGVQAWYNETWTKTGRCLTR